MQKNLYKKLSIIFQLKKWLLPAVALFVFNKANAADWYVNDASATGDVFTSAPGSDVNPGSASAPFATIQFAINTAAAGDTIYVDAGTYVAGDITISKSLTIRGAKFGIAAGPTAVPVNRGTDESNVNGSFYYGQSVDNISVDGFTVNTGTGLRGIQARGLNSLVINNIVTGIVTIGVQQAGISARANAPLRLHSYVIRNNNVSGFRFGIYFDGNLENSSVISFNYVTGSGTTGITQTASEGHQIRANVVENNFQGMEISRGNNIIEQNTIRGSTLNGIRMGGNPNLINNQILNNFFENNGVAINLTDPDPAAVNNQAHFNSFTGNVLNIVNTHPNSFDATCNWFGSTVPAVIALQLTGDVPFNPFLTDGTDTDPAPGFQPITTCVVPVILTGFTAAVKNYDVLLNWQTSSEVNSSHFIIEKSGDNQSFITAGVINAKGYSDIKVNYAFTDNKPSWFDRPTFYRLAMVDRDGTRKYSKTIAVVLKTSGSFVQQVYPNPARAGALLHTRFISGSFQSVTLSLMDAVGKTVKIVNVKVARGVNQIDLQLPAVISGAHFLLIRSDDNETYKVPLFIH